MYNKYYEKNQKIWLDLDRGCRVSAIKVVVRGNVLSPLELDEEEWNSTIKTNLTGTWLVSKYMCMLMRDVKQGGSIINISSIVGLDRGQPPGGLAYAASYTSTNNVIWGGWFFIFKAVYVITAPIKTNEIQGYLFEAVFHKLRRLYEKQAGYYMRRSDLWRFFNIWGGLSLFEAGTL
ncbi:hypothetical protein R6Q57_028449 [Mikania cordata]